jgi:poly(3-hydroxybutyrate) depolymerase
MRNNIKFIFSLAVIAMLFGQFPASAGISGRFKDKTSDAFDKPSNQILLNYNAREIHVTLPSMLPPEGKRALVVVLHGGMGNAERIVNKKNEAGMNLDDVASKYGFIVAYMNGTAVTRFLGSDKKGWNAGECCGQSSENNIDDVGYISGAVQMLVNKYGINTNRVYGIGHSNGAMMTLRIMCEIGLYSAGVSISGALAIETKSCRGANGRKIWAIHGENDSAVPIEGGMGSGISKKYPKRSQEYSKRVFDNSGAEYTLLVLKDAEHSMETIESAMKKQEGIELQEAIARFFQLSH